MKPEENPNKVYKYNRIIFHIDMDSFYASVEQQMYPQYKGKPLVVLGHGKGTAVIASSKEAKKIYGIKVGWKIYEARRVCPGIPSIPARIDLYEEVSSKIFKIFKKYSPFIEKFSIDEAFLDFSKVFVLNNDYLSIAYKIKKEIRENIGDAVTCSIGIASNRLMAKISSDLIKPDGIIWVPENRYIDVLDTLRLDDIPGIGSRIRKRLNRIGIYDFKELRRSTLGILKKEFGNVEGNFLYGAARGIDLTPVDYEFALPKSVGHHRSFQKDAETMEEAKEILKSVCKTLAFRLRRKSMKGKDLSFVIRNKRSEYFSYKIRCLSHTWDESVIYNSLKAFLKDEGLYPILFYAVTMYNLISSSDSSLSLFESNNKKDVLLKTMDSINKKYSSIVTSIPMV